MSFTKITTAGAGTMGSQVAWQMAFHGKHVIVYDPSPRACRRARRCIGSTPETTPNTQALESARYVDEHFIQKGHLGIASGQGFYRYPNPAFEQPGFI
jgi:3-hydroxyacyl-CoA dehydrogenase